MSVMSRAGAVIAMAAVAFSAYAAEALYPDIGHARADIAAAQKRAAAEHKRVLVDFGGNWCGDCKVLDANFHKPENAALLETAYVVVHVNVGDEGIDHNFDVAEQYGVPLKKGVPALVVTEPDGSVVYAQRNGEFESMRHMDPASVNEFLSQWKPKGS